MAGEGKRGGALGMSNHLVVKRGPMTKTMSERQSGNLKAGIKLLVDSGRSLGTSSRKITEFQTVAAQQKPSLICHFFPLCNPQKYR